MSTEESPLKLFQVWTGDFIIYSSLLHGGMEDIQTKLVLISETEVHFHLKSNTFLASFYPTSQLQV